MFYTEFDPMSDAPEDTKPVKEVAAEPKPIKKVGVKKNKDDVDDKINDLLAQYEKKTVVKTPKTKPVKDDMKIETNHETEKQKDKVENIEKVRLSIHNMLNNERFKDHLKEHGFKTTGLANKNEKYLRDYLSRIMYCAKNKNTSTVGNTVLKGVLESTENMITRLSGGKLLLMGTSANLFNNENFLDDLELFKMEYMSFANLDYKTNMVITIVNTGIIVNALNHEQLSQYQSTLNESGGSDMNDMMNRNVGGEEVRDLPNL